MTRRPNLVSVAFTEEELVELSIFSTLLVRDMAVSTANPAAAFVVLGMMERTLHMLASGERFETISKGDRRLGTKLGNVGFDAVQRQLNSVRESAVDATADVVGAMTDLVGGES